MSESKGIRGDMTADSPMRLILAFSIPLLLGNVLQQMYNMVDSIVVGNYVGTTALAAVGTGFPIIYMMVALFMGIGNGATVIISQYFGAGDLKKVSDTVDTIYTTGIVGALPVSVIGILLSGPLLRLINTPDNTFFDARLYMIIIFAGTIFSLGYNLNSAIMQSLGDSKTPLFLLAIACGLNVVLDLLFVIVFHWGVVGVAVATILAQAISWIVGIFLINRKYEYIHVNLLKFFFDKGLFQKIIELGLPAGLQQMLFSVGTLALQSLVNGYGSDFMAGFNGANKIDIARDHADERFMRYWRYGTGADLRAEYDASVQPGGRCCGSWNGLSAPGYVLLSAVCDNEYRSVGAARSWGYGIPYDHQPFVFVDYPFADGLFVFVLVWKRIHLFQLWRRLADWYDHGNHLLFYWPLEEKSGGFERVGRRIAGKI